MTDQHQQPPWRIYTTRVEWQRLRKRPAHRPRLDTGKQVGTELLALRKKIAAGEMTEKKATSIAIQRVARKTGKSIAAVREAWRRERRRDFTLNSK